MYLVKSAFQTALNVMGKYVRHMTFFMPPGSPLRPPHDCGCSFLPTWSQFYFRHIYSVTESSAVLGTAHIAYASR